MSIMASYATSMEPRNTQFKELITKPEKFDGRRVAVMGYLDTTEAHACDLRATAKRPDDIRMLINIKLPRPDDPTIRRLTNAYTRVIHVRVVGVFHHKKIGLIRSRPVSGDPHVKAIVNMQRGFGWMGLYDKEITDISEIKPVAY